MDQTAVAEALKDVRALVAGDGGDMVLEGVDDAGSVKLRLVLDGVDCHECVMPRSLLEDIAGDMLKKRVPGLASVSIDDPREYPGYVSPTGH